MTSQNDYSSILNQLRTHIKAHGLDGFLVSMADEYQSEYVPPSACRIAFLTGFTGSAGFVVVLMDKAAFFTDGRYTLQAEQQVPSELYARFDSADKTPSAWLAEHLQKGMKIGFDPWLHTAKEIERFEKALQKGGVTLEPTEPNLLDAVWEQRPSAPTAPIIPHEKAYAGIAAQDKCVTLASELKKKNLGAVVITDPASVAWLLNIRGGDVPNTPLPLSFAIVHDDAKVEWCVDARKLTPSLFVHLGNNVKVCTPLEFAERLDALGTTQKTVRIDPTEAAYWIVERLKTAHVQIDEGEDPSVLPRACKNKTETEGTKAAHLRDGVALAKFFAWLDDAINRDDLTEMSVAEKLESIRAESNMFRGPSFDTIAGAGSHGAIVHYRATPNTNRRLEVGQIFLLDSGGQYLDGTTDVTRTLALGARAGDITPEIRDRFTRVLKGHIALAAIKFPEGTTGAELDVLARQFLWDVGLDFAHGTGHGVGSYLGVHEGPQGISRRSHVALKPGMIVSNEPGYYKNGAYGIRIENLQIVTEAKMPADGEKPMLGFEPLTLAPIDRKLIEVALLTAQERTWLNDYHARVRQSLSGLLNEEERDWLEAATAVL